MSNGKSKPWITNLPLPAENDKPKGAADDFQMRSIPSDTLGLAISGGGIRSATFGLGILQALAKANWLVRIDFLSTVSGGGYIGGFLGRFFDQRRRITKPNPSGQSIAHRIVRDSLIDNDSDEIQWIRQHSNYLAPTGSGDEYYNVAAFGRNFCSLHFVLGIFFFAIFGLMNALAYSQWIGAEPGSGSFLTAFAPFTSHMMTDSSKLWWMICELSCWLAILPLSLAYWLVSQDRHESMLSPVLFSFLLLALAFTIAAGHALAIGIVAATIIWVVLGWHVIRVQVGTANPFNRYRMLLARHQLTKCLSSWLVVLVMLLGLGLINSIGQFIAKLFVQGELSWTALVAKSSLLFGPVIAVIPILRALAGFFVSGQSQPQSFLNKLGRFPFLIHGVVLVFGYVIPLSLIAFLSHASFGRGGDYWVGIAATGIAIVISLLYGMKQTLPFVNRCGPLPVYASRLSNVFLRAVNPAGRLRSRGQDVTTIVEGDDVPYDLYRPHEAGGPLHLFNVAVNETIDVVSQRGLRDRQAENMSVGPAGISISKRWHALWGTVNSDHTTIGLTPITTPTEPHPFKAMDGRPVNVERLNVREWMGISGAAVSSGAGRYSGPAFSLLVTLANLRLGYWWNSGLGAGERAMLPMADAPLERAKQIFNRIFVAQSLLISELRGRFAGPWRRHFYLSDGGHFEFTGVYELLRRRVPYIIAIDADEDREQQSIVLGELMRVVRIDFGAEFEEVSNDPNALTKFGIPPQVVASLGSVADVMSRNRFKNAKTHATLLRVSFPPSPAGTSNAWSHRCHSWLLFVRATMVGDEPEDLRYYRATHPNFPHETTLDQFFDEPQWESYRKLGQHIGEKLFV